MSFVLEGIIPDKSVSMSLYGRRMMKIVKIVTNDCNANRAAMF